MPDFYKYFEANRNNWNQRTLVHRDSAFYGLQEFKTGKTSLNKIELEELGDVKGKKLLHLQCHFGMDTMSWARQGAKCIGVDLSDESIRLAKELNREMKLDVEFILCNIYDLKKHLDEKFDIVFTSYGVIGWLPDLQKWAELISYYLKPGGIFYMVEFHPVVWIFDDDFTHIKYHYDNKEVIMIENEGTYTDRNADIKGKEYSWNHSISEMQNTLIHAGLQIQFFNEYMYSPYPCFRNLTEREKDQWQIKGMEGKIPMLYSIKAVKQ
ncbi:MAG: class I SAM-dependent methyltransferase [Bacteroidetes bacterium]|nr:class I SAM-dependent methyltransferase [Bacteroidota bacterium]MBS1930918.1 class I SAM-dependent methyltransferase [Bacteroidota bacterium]